jgi:hypothetical protein
MDESECRRSMRASGVLVNPTRNYKESPFLRDTNDAPPTRAAQMAATVEKKLKDLGQLSEAKPEMQLPVRGTPEQLARRAVLKAKILGFR